VIGPDRVLINVCRKPDIVTRLLKSKRTTASASKQTDCGWPADSGVKSGVVSCLRRHVNPRAFLVVVEMVFLMVLRERDLNLRTGIAFFLEWFHRLRFITPFSASGKTGFQVTSQ